ncbi:hypothetical protein CERSUDRAFT_46382 [Gelatoporia subvermispora B]|uniref:G-patch domain-containing protein n=1 Tax=Ceriporiopsis subvermispora (strain B) TaxID=914234 RepID=M2R5P0_CERS8|nr:hypothetical protein CERSUDRAFT_46382 [Gelatoporia subvermispora B]
MATVTHYIYSHYDPKDREALETATGQTPSQRQDSPEDDPWQTESAFGAQRRLAAAPRFVPAIISYDEINDMMGAHPALPEPKREESANDASNWYRSLTQSSSAPALEAKPALSAVASSSSGGSQASASAPVASGSTPRKREPRDKNNWFIYRALQSEPTSGRSTPTSTLADILDREPPPMPTDRPFNPPVFLTIGPSNRGFAMLQQSGWSEGEPLGAGVVRRTQQSPLQPDARLKKRPKREEGGASTAAVKMREIKLDPDEEIIEVKKVDVIDLTLSDSDEEYNDDDDLAAPEDVPSSLPLAPPEPGPSVPTHNPRALLTPLPTVLKSDRLGVGLKAKTEGPYRASKKRVTHSAAAVAAHVRATEEIRRMKTLVGRGTKGFARLAKAETEKRQRLLATLKGD